MPPPLAAFLTIGFICYLFRRDFRERPAVTAAIWLPTIWLFLSCSRPSSQWLAMAGIHFGDVPSGGAAEVMEEGSPIDRLVYFALIAAGIYVLHKRHIDVGKVVRENGWLAAFFMVCFLGVLWSDFPLVSFKRWIKVLGHAVMVLVIFTEPDPREAVITLAKRCAYVVLPVSILFIKYYSQWGRMYDPFSGVGSNTGITTNKNILGCACLILGLFLFWHFLQVRHEPKSRDRKREMIFTGALLLMVGYLLHKAHSATSTIGFALGVVIIVGLGLRFVNKRAIAFYASIIVVLLVVAQLSFDVMGSFVELTGHGSTIEGRGELWKELLKIHINPILGTGFESFWLGKRLEEIWSIHWWHPTEAHNGYLEIYLTLGIVGVTMLVCLLLATFHKARRELLVDFEWGRLRMAFLVAVVLYNWTEASFKGLHPMWFVFYIVAIDYARTVARRGTSTSLEIKPQQEPERVLAHTGWLDVPPRPY